MALDFLTLCLLPLTGAIPFLVKVLSYLVTVVIVIKVLVKSVCVGCIDGKEFGDNTGDEYGFLSKVW